MIETGLTIEGLDYTDEKGNKITSVHTFRDLGLILKTYYIPEPKVKETRISIPFASGSVDLTESAGYIPYEDRDGMSFEFLMKNKDYEDFNEKIQHINNMLHGKKVMIILDTDPEYYYYMRLNLDETKHNKLFSNVTITGVAEPFKQGVQASNDDWLWDPFNFYTGVIERATKDIVVDGGYGMVLNCSNVPTVPTFYVYQSSGLAVMFEGKTYNLPKTSNKAYDVVRIPQIKLTDKSSQLIFKGHGKVTVEYRKRYL